MKKTASLVFLYAVFVLTGGIIGYVCSKSTASLSSGVLFGILLLVSSFFMFKKKSFGYWMAISLSILLQGFFTWRFAKTLHFFPAGFMSFVSLAMIIIIALKIRSRKILVR